MTHSIMRDGPAPYVCFYDLGRDPVFNFDSIPERAVKFQHDVLMRVLKHLGAPVDTITDEKLLTPFSFKAGDVNFTVYPNG